MLPTASGSSSGSSMMFVWVSRNDASKHSLKNGTVQRTSLWAQNRRREDPANRVIIGDSKKLCSVWFEGLAGSVAGSEYLGDDN